MTKEIVIIYEYVKCARRNVERKEFNSDERKMIEKLRDHKKMNVFEIK